jgi:hypothetical protein
VRITKRQLRRIIKEEKSALFAERKLRQRVRRQLMREMDLFEDDDEDDDERREPPEIEIEDPGEIRGHGRS